MATNQTLGNYERKREQVRLLRTHKQNRKPSDDGGGERGVIMRRIWFKKEMAQEILVGNKISTTRYKEMSVAEPYKAIRGSRFKSEVFAVIKFMMVAKTTWNDVIQKQYLLEGFKSSLDMETYLKKNKLVRNNLDDVVYYHEFIVVSK